MKKIKIVLILLVIGFTSLLSAQETTNNSITIDELSTKLKNPDLPIEKDTKVRAYFKINGDNRINYVKVIAPREDYALANFVKTRLIYEKITSVMLEEDIVYVLPIKFLSK